MATLMLLTTVAVAAFFGMLAVFLRLIITALDDTGGRGDSLLARIRMGVRAIEVETGHLGPQVTELNAGLTVIADGLGAVDARLGGLAAAAARQSGGRS